MKKRWRVASGSGVVAGAKSSKRFRYIIDADLFQEYNKDIFVEKRRER